MTLNPPFQISSRLLPAVKVGEAWISIQFDGATSDGRARYRYFIDLPDGTEHTSNDLESGCGGGSLQRGMESLLGFLGACAESARPRYDRFGDGNTHGENYDLFPPAIAEWAYQNSDELTKDNHGEETGFGISACMQDNEHNIMVVDCPAQTVWTIPEKELKDGKLPAESLRGTPFTEFIS